MDRRTALRKGRSGEIAARRLKFLLTADKTGFPPETLAMIRNDIYRVVSRYVDVDFGQMELHLGRPKSAPDGPDICPALCAVIPVRSFRLKGTF